jgi:hypothetical protein
MQYRLIYPGSRDHGGALFASRAFVGTNVIGVMANAGLLLTIASDGAA